MQIHSLRTIAKLANRNVDRTLFAVLPPKALNLPVGGNPLDHAPEALHDFMQKHRWRHGYALIGLRGNANQLLESGEVVMSGSPAALMRYLLRWEALRVIPVWVDGFDALPAEEQTERARQIAHLDEAREQLMLLNSWYQYDEDHYQAARAVMRTGHWEMANLPELEGFEWPSGKAFGLTNPGQLAGAVEEGYLEGVFGMIESGESFEGSAGSIGADVLFGVAAMSPRGGYQLLASLYIQIEANRAETAFARYHRASA